MLILSGVRVKAVADMLEALSRAAFNRDISKLDVRSAGLYGWRILSSEYPIFDVVFTHPRAEPLRVRLTCDQWDELPPQIELLNQSGDHLPAPPPNHGSIFHPGPHRYTGRPFVCMRGSREYHTHESHVEDIWDNYKTQNGNDILGLVSQIWRGWKRAIQ